MIKKLVKKLFDWIFKAELEKLNSDIEKVRKIYEKLENQHKIFNNVLKNIDISVDAHDYHNHAKSWAVISLQGSKADYVKFVDLGASDIREIHGFLKQFERINDVKIDASPQTSPFLRINRSKF